MSKQASKTLIGAFVIGAIALIVAGIVVFGSGKLFASTRRFVMFFEGSVKGLNVGAPVIFQGVKIGEVVRIRLDFNPKDLSVLVPVFIEIDPRLLNVPKEFQSLLEVKQGKYPMLPALIERKGLKAQLQPVEERTSDAKARRMLFATGFRSKQYYEEYGEIQSPNIPTVRTETYVMVESAPPCI